MRRAIVFTAGICLGAGLLILPARVTRSQTASSYIGSEACKECHQQQWDSFQASPHGHVDGADQQGGGCESCHGPGSAHQDAGGDRTSPGFATIRNFKTMKPAEIAAVCQNCHSAGAQFYWDKSRHAQRGVSCLNCHDIHGTHGTPAHRALLIQDDVNQVCLQCHKDKRSSLSRSAHMPLREGSMTCADCHNPHGSSGPHMIKAASNNELCTSCHMDKRGPFLWEHPPVRENCMNCHQPHGANNAKVLASKEPYLCQRCHIATRHPSTLYDYPDLASNRLLNRSCTNCHSMLHGSNHPSGKTFLR